MNHVWTLGTTIRQQAAATLSGLPRTEGSGRGAKRTGLIALILADNPTVDNGKRSKVVKGTASAMAERAAEGEGLPQAAQDIIGASRRAGRGGSGSKRGMLTRSAAGRRKAGLEQADGTLMG